MNDIINTHFGVLTCMIRSILFIQIAVLINVLRPIAELLASIILFCFIEPSMQATFYLHVAVSNSTSVIAFGLMGFGVCRIVYLLRSEMPNFFSISIILLFGFLFLSKGLELLCNTMIVNGNGLFPSIILLMLMVVILPVGMVSCLMVAATKHKYFHFPQNQKNIMYWLSAIIGAILLIGIFLSLILWWQNLNRTGFSLQPLLMSYSYFQFESPLFGFLARVHSILLWLWQIGLLIFLQNIKKHLINKE